MTKLTLEEMDKLVDRMFDSYTQCALESIRPDFIERERFAFETQLVACLHANGWGIIEYLSLDSRVDTL